MAAVEAAAAGAAAAEPVSYASGFQFRPDNSSRKSQTKWRCEGNKSRKIASNAHHVSTRWRNYVSVTQLKLITSHRVKKKQRAVVSLL